MAPRSLRPQLNQIRAWVRQGRTDAWIAHQLEVSVKDLRQFKRDHELEAPESGESVGAAALEEGVSAEVLSTALYTRFRSREEHSFAEKILSAMRKGFGGHVERPAAVKMKQGL